MSMRIELSAGQGEIVGSRVCLLMLPVSLLIMLG